MNFLRTVGLVKLLRNATGGIFATLFDGTENKVFYISQEWAVACFLASVTDGVYMCCSTILRGLLGKDLGI